jgi:quinohemoprotein ethanol dehydrogenase
VRKAIGNSYRGALIAWDPVARRIAWRADRRGPHNGGTLAVAGGIVFQGTIDGHFLAIDAKTGKELWSFDNQAATLTGPVSHEVDGEQYVLVSAGYGGVFFLVNGLFLPNRGAFLYDTYCLQFHGIGAITGGMLPDLRKSGRLQNAALWKAAVVDEELSPRGMPRFGRQIAPADAELIRAYVARQAALPYQKEQAPVATH